MTTSRIPGFYAKTIADRVAALEAQGALRPDTAAFLVKGGGLELSVADTMSENVIAVHGLPLSVALNFRVNGRDVLVPMAIEEPSVVAACSYAARLARHLGGFTGVATAAVMTAQVQLDQVAEPAAAKTRIEAAKAELIALASASVPRLCDRGGGARDLDVRVLDAAAGVLVVHIHVDVGEAMGANLVDTVAEAIAPRVLELAGGRMGLRILTNLPLQRRVKVTTEIAASELGGVASADGIARASRFAELDPFRAVTHNKGIMNGVDAVAVALGQDWRAIEAAAHAYAAHEGTYKPLATWKLEAETLKGQIELPLVIGTVGGSTQSHAGVRAAFELLGKVTTAELSCVIAAAGLAANLAALRALAGEGIQKGHMRLHARKKGTQP